MYRTKTSGLTMIELVIVVGVLVFLTLLFSFSLSASQKDIRDTKRVADLNVIQTAVEFYFNAHGEYPVPIAEAGNAWGTLDELLAPYLVEGELPKPIAKDESYVYLYSGDAPIHFVVATNLEQESNKNLTNDPDGSFPDGSRWVSARGVTSLGAEISTISCVDPVYCVTD